MCVSESFKPMSVAPSLHCSMTGECSALNNSHHNLLLLSISHLFACGQAEFLRRFKTCIIAFCDFCDSLSLPSLLVATIHSSFHCQFSTFACKQPWLLFPGFLVLCCTRQKIDAGCDPMPHFVLCFFQLHSFCLQVGVVAKQGTKQ